MSVAILVPSLNRPYRLADVVANIHAATQEPHRIYFCVSDEDSIDTLDRLGEWYLDDAESDDRRYVTRMNKLIEHVEEEFIFFGSDDVIHHSGWFPKAKFVLDQGFSLTVVNDLRNQNGTQALIRKDYLAKAVFDAPGAAFHHGYQHNFADNEMFFTAYMQNQFSRAMDSYVEHLHPVFGHAKSMAWDSTYENARKGWVHDQQLFETRARLIEAALQGS